MPSIETRNTLKLNVWWGCRIAMAIKYGFFDTSNNSISINIGDVMYWFL